MFEFQDFFISVQSQKPPLRERREDKEVIAKYYLAKFCAQEGISKQFSHEALNTINQYVWPGNVRELINKIRRAMVISEGSIIMPSDFSIKDMEKENDPLLAWKKARIEKHELSKILQMNSYNVSKSAKLLGISRPTLYSLIRKYEIKKSKGD